jgi:hypothetical protein
MHVSPQATELDHTYTTINELRKQIALLSEDLGSGMAWALLWLGAVWMADCLSCKMFVVFHGCCLACIVCERDLS